MVVSEVRVRNKQVCSASGKTALFHAINTHNVAAVMLLLKQSCDVNKASYVAYHRDNQLLSCVEPPLITAVRVGCREVIQLLLTCGARVRISFIGSIPLEKQLRVHLLDAQEAQADQR